MLTRNKYNKVLQLVDTGVSHAEACRKLNVNYKTFIDHWYWKAPFKNEYVNYSRMKWNNDTINELRECIKNSSNNLFAAFEEFANKYNIRISTVQTAWNKFRKVDPKLTSFVVVGDKTTSNIKNVIRGTATKRDFISSTTEAIKEIHNIQVFSTTVTWKFNYIYKP